MAGDFTQGSDPVKKKRGRPKKVKQEEKLEAGAVTVPASTPPAAPSVSSEKSMTTVKVTSETYREVLNEKGKLVIDVVPWQHTVKYQGKRYDRGEVFSCGTEIAEHLIDIGVVQDASKPDEPFRPDSLSREMQTSHGIERKSSVVGKIPKSNFETGERGGWDEEDETF